MDFWKELWYIAASVRPRPRMYRDREGCRVRRRVAIFLVAVLIVVAAAPASVLAQVAPGTGPSARHQRQRSQLSRRRPLLSSLGRSLHRRSLRRLHFPRAKLGAPLLSPAPTLGTVRDHAYVAHLLSPESACWLVSGAVADVNVIVDDNIDGVSSGRRSDLITRGEPHRRAWLHI